LEKIVDPDLHRDTQQEKAQKIIQKADKIHQKIGNQQ